MPNARTQRLQDAYLKASKKTPRSSTPILNKKIGQTKSFPKSKRIFV